MIKLKNLINEGKANPEQEKKIVDTLLKAEKIIERSVNRHDIMRNGTFEWLTDGKMESNVDLRPDEWYIVKARVSGEENDTKYQVDIYARGRVSGFGSDKGEIIYQANIFESSGSPESFDDSKRMLRWLEDNIKDYSLMNVLRR